MSTATVPSCTISRERLFAEWLADQPAQAFDWASANCCHFASAWVQHAEGSHPMAALPVTKTGAAAARLLRKLGDMQAAITLQLAREPIAAALLAQTGDVVLIPAGGDTGWLVGICSGAHIVVRDVAGNVLFAPLSSGVAAWRINPVACA